MLIVCPSCATSYDVTLASLQPDGRQVRCVRCRTVWRAEPTQAEKLLAAADAIAPEPQLAHAATTSSTDDPMPAMDHPVAASGPDHPADEPAADTGSLPAAENNVSPDPPGMAVAVEAPPIVPADLEERHAPIEIEAAAEPVAEELEDIETYAARRQRRDAKRRLLRWPLSNLQSAVLALMLIDAILIGWRDEFVRILPQTASFYAMMGLPVNVRGVAFDDIATTMEQHEGVPILVVHGNIVNDTHKLLDVPRLKFAVRNAANQEIYSWTVVSPRATLPPGETVSFRSRLASPPTEGRDVLVRFVTHRDIIAGAR
jgi:predicted Zn finger-like uncharacterized protein